MKKLFVALFCFIVITGFASAQNLPSITIVNDTGYRFTRLYIAESTSDSWGSDILGSTTLRSGYQVGVTLPHPLSKVNQYDIKAVDSDGDSYTKCRVVVTANAIVEFTMNDINRTALQQTPRKDQQTIQSASSQVLTVEHTSQQSGQRQPQAQQRVQQYSQIQQRVYVQHQPYLIYVVPSQPQRVYSQPQPQRIYMQRQPQRGYAQPQSRSVSHTNGGRRR